MGLVKGCPSLWLQAAPAAGWWLSPCLGQLKVLNHWDLSVALSSSLGGLQIITVHPAKAHAWLKALFNL